MAIGKTVALIQIPNQRAFRSGPAARYCGVDTDTLHKYTNEDLVQARELNGHRVYLLEELDRFLESLPIWNNAGRPQPVPATSERKTHAG